MGYLKSDVDLRLLYIILGIGLVLVVLTVMYQGSLGKINNSNDVLEKQLAHLKNNMSKTLYNLEMCKNDYFNLSLELNDTKQFLLKSREEYNVIYEETEGELEKTQEDLVNKDDLIASLKTQVALQINNIAKLQKQTEDLSENVDELEKTNSKLEKYKKDADEFMDDFDHCKNNDNQISCYTKLERPD